MPVPGTTGSDEASVITSRRPIRSAARRLADQLARTRWKLGRPREITARVVKRVRNLVADPWPRTAELLYLGYDLAPPDIAFRFRLGRHTYTHHVTLYDLPEDTFAGLRGAEWEPLLHHIGLMFAVYHWRV